MYTLLFSIIVAIFLALLFLNIYFRVKVLKYYKILSKNKVEFPAKYILNKKKLEEEVLPVYPKWKDEISAFCGHIRYSVKIASILMTVITILGGILMYYDKYVS